MRALVLLYKNNVVHGDIKPANVVRAADGNLKLIDFDNVFMYRGVDDARRLLTSRFWNYVPPVSYPYYPPELALVSFYASPSAPKPAVTADMCRAVLTSMSSVILNMLLPVWGATKLDEAVDMLLEVWSDMVRPTAGGGHALDDYSVLAIARTLDVYSMAISLTQRYPVLSLRLMLHIDPRRRLTAPLAKDVLMV